MKNTKNISQKSPKTPFYKNPILGERKIERIEERDKEIKKPIDGSPKMTENIRKNPKSEANPDKKC